MPTTRMLTAILLTSMMMLSGCLGTDTGDDTEDGGGGGIIPTAQGSTVTTIVNGNYLPMVHAAQMGIQRLMFRGHGKTKRPPRPQRLPMVQPPTRPKSPQVSTMGRSLE